jgi:hypothetical protein
MKIGGSDKESLSQWFRCRNPGLILRYFRRRPFS